MTSLEAAGAELPAYALYAIRYASRDAMRAENFMGGDPHDAPMPMDYFVWVAVHPTRTVLVDIGFSAQAAAKRRRNFLCDPIEALTLLDIDPDSIADVVITHLHYDHAGNFTRLPKAHFHLQEPEMHFAAGRHMRFRYFSSGYEVDDIVDAVRLNFAGRLMQHAGEYDLAPGIRLVPAPGHSPGQQIVCVHTTRGWVVLASDAAHYFEHLQRRRPYPAAHHIDEMLESFDLVMDMAGEIERVIPGHDPLVMQIYPPASEALVGRIARLDVQPAPLPVRPRAKAAG